MHCATIKTINIDGTIYSPDGSEGVQLMLDYRMDTFLAVCRYMNFTHAAEELHMAQSTVSLHIHSLETYYGEKLFLFHGKKIKLTETGQMLLDFATTQLLDEQRLKRKIQSKNQAPIRLGATLSVAESMICRPLASFLSQHPRDYIQIDIDNTQHLLQKINSGILDAAFVEGSFPAEEFYGIPYRQEPFIAVCAPDFSGCKTWRKLEDLFRAPLLLREKGSGTRGVLESFLAERWCGLQNFSRIIEIGSIHLIKEVVKAGIGVTFLYEAAVKQELSDGTLYKIPIKDCDFYHEISYLWRKDSLYSVEYENILREFMDTEKE